MSDQQLYTDTEEPFHFNEELGIYSNVPKTEAGIDSLLSIAESIRSEIPQKANRAALQAREISEEINYKQGIASSNKHLGAIYMTFGDHDIALNYLFEALELNRELENQSEIAHVINVIASVHVMQQNYERAVEFFSEAVRKMEELGNINMMAMSMMNLGVSHYYMDDFETALEYYESTRKITEEEVHDPRLHMVSITNIGNVLIELEEFEQAEEYLKTAIEFFSDHNMNVNLSGSYLYLSKLYHRMSRLNEALINAENGRQVAKDIGQSQYILEAYELLANIHEDLGDYESAFSLYKQFHEHQKEVLNSERSSQINRMQIQFDVEQKDREIELLNKEAALRESELAQRQMWQNVFIGGFIIFGFIAVLLFRYNAQKKKANRLLNERSNEIKKKNEQLIRLNEEKNEFLGIAAHDLRSPLSSIIGFTDLLQQSDNIDKKDKDQYLQLIKKSTNRMLYLINNLLNVNAIESGFTKQKIERLDIRETLKSVINSFESKADKKYIKLNVELSEKELPVLADSDQLWSIFENLVSNACKFSPKGVTVNISTKILEDQNSVQVTVQDNGPGITQEDQKKLFGRFQRLTNKPTGNESSIGLGLYIVKNLTESLGGTIKCKSTPGKGSQFIVTFPLAEANQKHLQPA